MSNVVPWLKVQEWAKNTFLTEWEVNIVNSIVPFGEYKGMEVNKVPLRYLFETITDMRPSLFIVSIGKLLSREWFLEESLRGHTNERFQYKHGVTWMHLYQTRCERLCPLVKASSLEKR